MNPRRERIGDAAQLIGLLILVPVGAELLAVYSDNTGQVGKALFAVVFFAGLYGAPALLIREVVRRQGWGWSSLLLLAASLAVLQAGVIDQSLFSVDYGDYEGFREGAEPTWIAPLGISAFNTQGFLIGHVVFSFAAPLALAEAWRPGRSRAPWTESSAVVWPHNDRCPCAALCDDGRHDRPRPGLIRSRNCSAGQPCGCRGGDAGGRCRSRGQAASKVHG